MSNVMEVRLNEDSLETINCGNRDVNGDLFTVPERTEIEKRFQMFYLLKRNQCNLDSAFSVQPGSRIVRRQHLDMLFVISSFISLAWK